MISKLHYITQESIAGKTLIDLTENALKGGIDWVQLRMKKAPYQEFLENAKVIRHLTKEYGAKLIINDNVQIASEVGADGVHLGMNDMPVHDARLQLGLDKIVGGTCNTFEDLIRRTCENVDYIGLGPLRFTSTKSALSPIIGFEGFKEIFKQLHGRNIKTPIIGIGGIEPEDVCELQKIGLFGVAVAGVINRENDPSQVIRHFKELLK
jgi:thiamine-phosphate pyrophosphorylase